jgi:hypothetical protein
MIETIGVVVSALAMGAAGGVKETASQAVRDAYTGLKELIRHKYKDVNVAPVEAKPDSKAKRDSLAEDLASAGAGADTELLEHARALIEAVYVHDRGAATSVGVDLEEVRADSLRIRDIRSDGTGVRVRKSDFFGDIDIQGVTGGRVPSPPKI